MPAPTPLTTLIARFHHEYPAYKSGRYNETEARVHLINPLFEALGWDVADRLGRGEVKHEDRLPIAGKSKAPDYGFRLDGKLRFFVEAKKPAVDLDRLADPAYQLRRYTWTAKLPLGILTDFEEFAIYDGRVRPVQGDKPAVARLRYWRYTEYADAWDEIAATFSRDAVLAGSLEQYAAERGGKRGVAAVDAEFLKEIEHWRDLLARHLALRNPRLTQRDLNFAVQQTIDRLIFLRIAEDRAIEPYGQLRDLATGPGTFDRLMAVFLRADQRYNSGLFHFGHEKGRGDPDRLTPALQVDDKPLKEIIRALYEPVSPYEFSVFPADILGQVYEQFLGKVIRLTDGHRAVVEEKPEVRKAGGVYYTPTYIVEYIVRQTVGRLVEGHAPDPAGPASRLRVLDPACGSGSFLLGAYQFLLDWHLAGYLQDVKKWSRKRGGTLHQTAAGEYRLTLAERKRILLDNLYGVDIDPQAVEVTKLSLLLKVLEDTPESLGAQLQLFAERVLPDLGDNVKCGNSLIGPDFYAQAALLPDADAERINAFDWRREFKGVMDAGGFDAVIGNPPYIRIQALKEWAPVEVEYYKRAYRAAGKGNYDIYVVFVERGLELLNERGRLGFILPHKFFNAQYGAPLRGVIAAGKHLSGVVHFGDQQVFAGATTY
uniref:Eco57I restriction-modification methylase domain-containing protein n=1 Tax=Promineifilum sp. TaxID=2664178 RepID=UPI0035AF6D88